MTPPKRTKEATSTIVLGACLAPALRGLLRSYLNPAQPSTSWEECSPRGRHHALRVPVKRPRFSPRPHALRDPESVCQGSRPQALAALREGAAARKVPRGVQTGAPGSGCLPGMRCHRATGKRPSPAEYSPAGPGVDGDPIPYPPHATRRPRDRPRGGASHWWGNSGFSRAKSNLRPVDADIPLLAPSASRSRRFSEMFSVLPQIWGRDPESACRLPAPSRRRLCTEQGAPRVPSGSSNLHSLGDKICSRIFS